MNKNTFTASGDLWDLVFRALDADDEQAIVRFIRMVVANQPDLPAADPSLCPAH